MWSGVRAEVYEVEWCSVFDSCDVVGEPAEFAETEGFTGFEKFLLDMDDPEAAVRSWLTKPGNTKDR